MSVDTWIEVSGVTIAAPVTAGTNLLLAVQCALCAHRLRGGGSTRRTWWGGFFAAMALATLAGVPKHAFAHLLTDSVYNAILWTSSIAGGAAVYFAQRATIASRVAPLARRTVERVTEVLAVLFLGVSLAVGPEMMVLVGYTAVGLLPVIVAEAAARLRGDRCGAHVAAGLIVSMLTGLVYGFELTLGRWFNHIDLAHVLMGVSFYLILTGVRYAVPTRVEETLGVMARATAVPA